MKKAIYKKVDERIEKVTIHHEESIDELGNIIEAYDEVVEKVIPIMGVVYEEMTQEEIEAITSQEPCDNLAELTLEERVYNLETQTLQNAIDNAYLQMMMEEGVYNDLSKH